MKNSLPTDNNNENYQIRLSELTQDIKMWLAENFIAKYTVQQNTMLMEFTNGQKFSLSLTEIK